MSLLMGIHIAGGTLAILAGTVAVFARKGGPLHARAGTIFFAAMLVLGGSASILAGLNDEPDSPLTGLFISYFVLTSWVTVRRRDGKAGKFELAAAAFALATAALLVWGGFNGATTPAGVGPVFALATLYGLAALGDLRTFLRGRLTPVQRIARHLWRMCFAFFVATGSFFLGQQDVMPEGVRGSPALFVLAFAPFAVMAFWLVRIRIGRRFRLALA